MQAEQHTTRAGRHRRRGGRSHLSNGEFGVGRPRHGPDSPPTNQPTDRSSSSAARAARGDSMTLRVRVSSYQSGV